MGQLNREAPRRSWHQDTLTDCKTALPWIHDRTSALSHGLHHDNLRMIPGVWAVHGDVFAHNTGTRENTDERVP
jgi:hypothetical protein